MVPLWCIFGLIIAAVSVSSLGATFSIFGLKDLFAGAAVSVMAMGAALEFGKFVLAAYLHQRWFYINSILRAYLVFSIIVLSGITSMGIFGYLSNAYQSASSALDQENLKLDTLKGQQQRLNDEVARLNHNVESIPDSRISKKLSARAEVEPMIKSLNQQLSGVYDQISQVNFSILQTKQKVGPLLYIAKIFNMNIDVIVKYLILVFVSVFDPLAICLVIASSEALNSRKHPEKNQSALQAVMQSHQQSPQQSFQQNQVSENASSQNSQEEIVQMRFVDDDSSKAS